MSTNNIVFIDLSAEMSAAWDSDDARESDEAAAKVLDLARAAFDGATDDLPVDGVEIRHDVGHILLTTDDVDRLLGRDR